MKNIKKNKQQINKNILKEIMWRIGWDSNPLVVD